MRRGFLGNGGVMNGAMIALIVVILGAGVAMWLIQRGKAGRSDKADRP